LTLKMLRCISKLCTAKKKKPRKVIRADEKIYHWAFDIHLKRVFCIKPLKQGLMILVLAIFLMSTILGCIEMTSSKKLAWLLAVPFLISAFNHLVGCWLLLKEQSSKAKVFAYSLTIHLSASALGIMLGDYRQILSIVLFFVEFPFINSYVNDLLQEEKYVNQDDPQYIEVPPRLGEFNRVIIVIPKTLAIHDILVDLAANGFLEEPEEHEMYEGHCVIKRDNEKHCRKMMDYLNPKYGPIAEFGYVQPDDDDIKLNYYEQVKTKGHVATVASAIAENPNEQFFAYEEQDKAKSGMPVYHRVDIEGHIGYVRPEASPSNNKYLKAKFSKKKNGAMNQIRVRTNKFGATKAQVSTEIESRDEAADDLNLKNAALNNFNGSLITSGAEVSPRSALVLDYTRKARKFRVLVNDELDGGACVNLGKKGSIIQQFNRDHTQNVIRIKKKAWQLKRVNQIYQKQKDKKTHIVSMKQELDPNVPKDTSNVWYTMTHGRD